MCGVIGAIIKKPHAEDFLMLHRVFLESKIRGLHATGIAYVKNNEIVIDKRPVPADEFPFNFPSYVMKMEIFILSGIVDIVPVI